MDSARRSLIVIIALALGTSGGGGLGRTKAKSYWRVQDSGAASASSARAVSVSRPGFELSMVSTEMIEGFGRAWKASGNGHLGREVVLLILRGTGASYKVLQLPPTNEYRRFTLAWNPETVAVVHTHPNRGPPEPQAEDIQTAERFGVPVFTLSIYGMFVYDPRTKKTTKIHAGLDWLKPPKWARYSQLAARK